MCCIETDHVDNRIKVSSPGNRPLKRRFIIPVTDNRGDRGLQTRWTLTSVKMGDCIAARQQLPGNLGGNETSAPNDKDFHMRCTTVFSILATSPCEATKRNPCFTQKPVAGDRFSACAHIVLGCAIHHGQSIL